MIYSVYKLTTSHGIYVGMTSDMKQRAMFHYKSKAEGIRSCGKKVHNAIRKSDDCCLLMEEICRYDCDRRDILIVEKYWINKLKSKLNECPKYRDDSFPIIDDDIRSKEILSFTPIIINDLKYNYEYEDMVYKFSKLSLETSRDFYTSHSPLRVIQILL
jgi:hypothetical protein